MRNDSVKVRKDEMEKWMKCSLCNNIFSDATTISECLHTFCKECICKQLIDEEFECCPICETDLGPVPQQKLRPDPIIQALTAKIFASKKRKIDTRENMPAATTAKVPTQSPGTFVNNLTEGKMHTQSYLQELWEMEFELYKSSLFDDELLEDEIEFTNDIQQQVEPSGGLIPEFYRFGSDGVEMEKWYYHLINVNRKLKAELASSASIAAENQKLREKLAACKASNITLEHRLKIKEAEVNNLGKKCNSFWLGISNVENELKKIKQSISR